jgi:hypothetical protein
MEKNKSHAFNFAFEALPILFHSQTNDFIKHLEKDGIKFLRFWWDHVGDKMGEANRAPWRGLDFTIEKVDEKTKLVWIKMPTPVGDEEAYFTALMAKPEFRFVWVRWPNSLAFALRRWDAVKEPPRTMFGFLTQRALFRPLIEGISPDEESFKRAVYTKIKRRSK